MLARSYVPWGQKKRERENTPLLFTIHRGSFSFACVTEFFFIFPVLCVDAREIIHSSTTSKIQLPRFSFKLLEHFSGRVTFHAELELNNFLFL